MGLPEISTVTWQLQAVIGGDQERYGGQEPVGVFLSRGFVLAQLSCAVPDVKMT